MIFQGNLYGDGVYFAVDASVSSKFSTPDSNGYCFMFYCSVLTGEYTLGTKGMKSPPMKNVETQDCYDSVCDKIASPTMFIIFNDTTAYPTHLVIFRQHSIVPCRAITWWEPPNKPSRKFLIYVALDLDHVIHRPVNFVKDKLIRLIMLLSSKQYATKILV